MNIKFFHFAHRHIIFLTLLVILNLSCAPEWKTINVHGKVFDENSQPVTGAKVLIRVSYPSASGGYGNCSEATTDEQGQYFFKKVGINFAEGISFCTEREGLITAKTGYVEHKILEEKGRYNVYLKHDDTTDVDLGEIDFYGVLKPSTYYIGLNGKKLSQVFTAEEALFSISYYFAESGKWNEMANMPEYDRLFVSIEAKDATGLAEIGFDNIGTHYIENIEGVNLNFQRKFEYDVYNKPLRLLKKIAFKTKTNQYGVVSVWIPGNIQWIFQPKSELKVFRRGPLPQDGCRCFGNMKPWGGMSN